MNTIHIEMLKKLKNQVLELDDEYQAMMFRVFKKSGISNEEIEYVFADKIDFIKIN